MKVTLLVIGKTEGDYLNKGIAIYLKRLEHYLPFELKVIPELKNTKNISEAVQKTKEGELLLEAIQSGDHLILLDEGGKEFTSKQYAEFLQKKMLTGIKNIVFVIGGPYGFSDAVYAKANGKMSLSKMTFSHQMVRLIFVEQLYRALTIIKGEPYHHE